MDEISKAITEKKTISTGRRIGLKKRAIISLAINDESREVSRLLEIVKKYYSGKKITAAEAYRTVVMRGLCCVIEEITLKQNALAKTQSEQEQCLLFDLKTEKN